MLNIQVMSGTFVSLLSSLGICVVRVVNVGCCILVVDLPSSASACVTFPDVPDRCFSGIQHVLHREW